MPYSLHGPYLLYYGCERREGVDHDGEVAIEQTGIRVNIDRSEQGIFFLINYRRDIADDAYVVVTYHTQSDAVLGAALARPFCFHNTVRISLLEVPDVDTVGSVNSYSSGNADESFNLVAIDRVAAASQLIVDALEILVDDENVRTVVV